MYSTVIVPLDGSAFGELAIAPAVALSTRSHAGLLLVRVHERVPSTEYRGPVWDDFLRCEGEAYLETLAARVQATFCGTVDWTLLDGHVVPAICARAESLPAALVVMSTHGRTGISRAWMGSVATGVVRHSSAPVVTMRPPSSGTQTDGFAFPFANVIVALDGSASAEEVLPHAVSVACACDARLLLLRVIDPTDVGGNALGDAAAYLGDVARQWSGRCRSLDLRVESHVSAAGAILECAATLERPLIALASHGRGLSSLFLGSVADEVVRGSADALLVVRRRI